MARRRTTEAKIEALNAWRHNPPPELVAELPRYISDKSGVVVAKAVRLAAAQGLSELADTIAESSDRFLTKPVDSDPGCRAKFAIATALNAFDHPGPDVFLRGVRHHQPEAA
jgi:hypothetical protein